MAWGHIFSVSNSMDDVQILQESISRPVAFALIVDRYQSAFLKKARYILRNEDEAEDAVQDTFVKIYANANKFAKQKGASFSSWAYKILLNTCYSRYKKLKRDGQMVAVINPDLLALAPSQDEAYFEDKLQIDFLVSLIATLPEKLKRSITLCFLKGWSCDEVAAVEGVSTGAVRTRIHRAKRLLTEKIYDQR